VEKKYLHRGGLPLLPRSILPARRGLPLLPRGASRSRSAYWRPGAVNRRRQRGRAEGTVEASKGWAGACSGVGGDTLQLVEWVVDRVLLSMLGLMGLNGPTTVFSFSFFCNLLQINTKCTQIWKFLTPSHSINHELFLKIFNDFFHFFEFKFEFFKP
jgi:hypothetical protein